MNESRAKAGTLPSDSSQQGPEAGQGGTAPACDNLREDHRQIETYLDRLLAALQHPSAARLREFQAIVAGIQRLSAVHFEKEEGVLFPIARTIVNTEDDERLTSCFEVVEEEMGAGVHEHFHDLLHDLEAKTART